MCIINNTSKLVPVVDITPHEQNSYKMQAGVNMLVPWLGWYDCYVIVLTVDNLSLSECVSMLLSLVILNLQT